MSNFFDDLLADNNKSLVTKPVRATVITFSNSGKGGHRKWFAMTSAQLVQCLEDMLANLPDFSETYEEKEWRRLFETHLTDDVARTMGAVQTLSLFEILAKIVHYASETGPRSFKVINLDPVALRQAIDALSKV